MCWQGFTFHSASGRSGASAGSSAAGAEPLVFSIENFNLSLCSSSERPSAIGGVEDATVSANGASFLTSVFGFLPSGKSHLSCRHSVHHPVLLLHDFHPVFLLALAQISLPFEERLLQPVESFPVGKCLSKSCRTFPC